MTGAIPPLNDADWQAAFDLYRQSPQYQQVNRGMTLADFKFIFSGNISTGCSAGVIGLAFALPLAWFAVKRAIPRGYGWKLVALLALGGLQGAIGWWMVASGLVDRPEVSHIRLAVHLLTAFADLRRADLGRARPARAGADRRWRGRRGSASPRSGRCALLAVQMLFGAYVAGLEAGYAFNTWPLMGDELYPAAAPMDASRSLRNFVDNPVMVQFVHRWLAFVAAAAIGLLALAGVAGGRPSARPMLLAGAVLLQIQLGIADDPDRRAAVDRRRPPGDGGAAARRGGDDRAPARRAAGMSRHRHRLRDLRATRRRRSGSRASWSRSGSPPAPTSSAPCRSIYRWQGEVEEAEEVPALFKTRAEARRSALIARLGELHSYDVPAAVVWPIADALPAYAQWVRDETALSETSPLLGS